MLCKKALRKILITTFTLFTLFVIYIIPEKLSNRNYLDVDMDVEYVVSLGTNEIYLLGPNNYLVKTNVLLESETIEGKIEGIIDYLTIKKSDKLPVGLSGIIPEATKLNQVTVKDHIATLDFSEELFQGMAALEERIIEGIAYSILNLEEIDGVTLKVEGVLIQELPTSKKKFRKLSISHLESIKYTISTIEMEYKK